MVNSFMFNFCRKPTLEDKIRGILRTQLEVFLNGGAAYASTMITKNIMKEIKNYIKENNNE